MDKRNFVIIIHGPTGVGKTECADYIASHLPVEIVNCDMGQLYKPLSIGTAKPDWKAASVAHHLFDVIDTPTLFTVLEYRKRVQEIVRTIWKANKIPIIIGGSSFYINSLFFPPLQHEKPIRSLDYSQEPDVWKMLHAIDPERAKQIKPSDTYRITRALDLWFSTGIKPSQYVPRYDPIADYYFVWLTRDRDDLYCRIDKRVHLMMECGWLDEVRTLHGTAWQEFITTKKIIGYNELFEYLEGSISYERMVSLVQQRTRRYAKRQMTFWRMLKKKLEIALKTADERHQQRCHIDTVNLTNTSIERYSKQLKHALESSLL